MFSQLSEIIYFENKRRIRICTWIYYIICVTYNGTYIILEN